MRRVLAHHGARHPLGPPTRHRHRRLHRSDRSVRHVRVIRAATSSRQTRDPSTHRSHLPRSTRLLQSRKALGDVARSSWSSPKTAHRQRRITNGWKGRPFRSKVGPAVEHQPKPSVVAQSPRDQPAVPVTDSSSRSNSSCMASYASHSMKLTGAVEGTLNRAVVHREQTSRFE
jgi:hypothetical protein